jgi:dUTP pyrophosphatase
MNPYDPPMELPVRLLTATAQLPSRAHDDDDAAFDLRADESIVIAPGRRATVRTGVSLALAPGTAGLVLPRSGLAARHGITVLNAPGLIDPGYRGEVMVILLNTDTSTPFEIVHGERIAQLLILDTAATNLAVTEADLDTTTRGVSGLGSTGR